MTQPPLDTLWNYADPAASEQRFAERLASLGDAPAGDRAEALTQIARARGLQRRFADAHATLDHAEALAPDGRARVRISLERGRVHNSSAALAAARPCFLDAWDRARALGEDGLAVDAAHMLGVIGPEADEWNARAIALAESSPQPGARRWVASLCNNIGWAHHDAGRPGEALAMFRRALDERERAGARAPLLIARWAVARALRTLGRHAEALDIQLALLAEHARDGTSDGFVHEELAENLLLLGRAAEARPHLARAFALLSLDPGLVEREPARVAGLGQRAAAT
jgi:tetratricopeptide (TPR) repeat protein